MEDSWQPAGTAPRQTEQTQTAAAAPNTAAAELNRHSREKIVVPAKSLPRTPIRGGNPSTKTRAPPAPKPGGAPLFPPPPLPRRERTEVRVTPLLSIDQNKSAAGPEPGGPPYRPPREEIVVPAKGGTHPLPPTVVPAKAGTHPSPPPLPPTAGAAPQPSFPRRREPIPPPLPRPIRHCGPRAGIQWGSGARVPPRPRLPRGLCHGLPHFVW